MQQADLDSYSRLAIRMSQTVYASAILGALSMDKLAVFSREILRLPRHHPDLVLV
ncbi:hypothetical protein IG631_14934 [Alternaria alternata]|jgi:hypothetical protein|nr:hypothetical protein IG631_14934 [Alternaria alternata]